MKKLLLFTSALVLLTLIFGCTQINQRDNNTQLIGGDKDAHGCLIAAGYSWCEAKNKCLRIWEEQCSDTNNQNLSCTCPNGYVQDGEVCNPQCYYATPKCLAPSIKCTLAPGLANPASLNCIDHNGSLKIVDTNEGQVGMCTLPSGKVCEEWAFFRGECTQ